MSLLRAHGHAAPEKYTIAAIWSEAAIVKERVLAERAATVQLLRLAMLTLPNELVAERGRQEMESRYNALIAEHLGD